MTKCKVNETKASMRTMDKLNSNNKLKIKNQNELQSKAKKQPKNKPKTLQIKKDSPS